MSASQGSVPFQLNNGRWRAVYYDPDGKRRYVERASRRKCQQALRERLAERDAGVVHSTMTVGDFLDKWLRLERRRTGDSGTTGRDFYDLQMIPEWFRSKQLVQVKASTVDQLIAEWLISPSPATDQPRATSTVARARRTLKKVFDKAMADDLIHKNPVALSRPVSVHERPAKPFTLTEARTFLNSLEGHRLWALYVLVVTLGLRESEVIDLRWRDVDLDEGTVRVAQQSPRHPRTGNVTSKEPKSRAGRRLIHLPAHVREALETRHEQAVTEGRAAPTDNVWLTSAGTPYGHRNLLRHLHRQLHKLGLERRRFHDLRHSAGTILLSMGLSERVIMDILGHADPRMITTYQHVETAVQKAAADQITEGWTIHDNAT